MSSSEEPARSPAGSTDLLRPRRRMVPSPRGARPRRRVVPSPLGVLLLAVALIGCAWALLVPPFQAPDESSHFAYAESLATRLAVPGDPRRSSASSAQAIADEAVHASDLALFTPSVRPDWSADAFRAYLADAQTHPNAANGGGPNAQAVNPPLFYLFSDVAYWLSGSDSVFGRLYAMRIWGVALLLLTVVGGWLLAGEVLPGRPLSQLMCAAVCGLIPMETFIATSVNPDALMVPLWTLAFWLGARLIGGDVRARTIFGLCAVTAAAVLTKATSYALVPAVVLALALAAFEISPARRRAVWRTVLTATAVAATPVIAWIIDTTSHGRSPINTVPSVTTGPVRHFNIREFLSYVWQFYLPRLPFQTRFSSAESLGVLHVWLPGVWARFGWNDVGLPGWTDVVFGAVSASLAVAAAAIVTTTRAVRGRARLCFFATALLALLAGLHLTDYRAIIAGENPLLQGRYLLPAIGLFGLCAAVVAARIPPRWRGAVCGAAVTSLFLLHVLSLATVAKTYYT